MDHCHLSTLICAALQASRLVARAANGLEVEALALILGL